MNLDNNYSVILPTLNESGHINSLVKDISENFLKLKLDYEIIVVDDCSTDGTVEKIEKKNLQNLIIHKRQNKKKSLVQSLNEGIKIAKYNNIIWMDADYSHPPEFISEFLKIKNKQNLDLIVCSRFLKDSRRYYYGENLQPAGIDILSQILNKICRSFLFKDLTDYTSGYICIKSSIIKNLKLKGYYGDYFISLLTKCKANQNTILEIPFIEKKRASGASKTTSNKFNFLIKCFFYLTSLIRSILIKFN